MSRSAIARVGRVRAIALLAMVLSCAGYVRYAAAAEPGGEARKSAADLLPPSTLAYVEITRPKDVIDLVLDHPLRGLVEQSPDFHKALESPQFKEFRSVVSALEQRAGVQWRPALEQITGGGVVFAFEPVTQGVVMLVRPDDPKAADKVRDALFSLAKDDAAAKGNPNPIETKEYRGLTAYRVGEHVVASAGPWLMVSSKPALAKLVADSYLDGGDSLAADKQFAEAHALAADGTSPAAWAYVKVTPVRLFGLAKELLNNTGKSDNPGVEFILGGLLSTLANTPYVTASLGIDGQGVRQNVKLSVDSPNDPTWVPEKRKFFFAPKGGDGGGADAPLRPRDTVLSVTTYRDVAAMWQASPDLFTEGVAAQMAQADSGLSTFLGGKSFSADVLGAFRPQMQFVAVRQDYKAAGVPEPTLRLPAGAVVLRFKDKKAAQSVRRHFRVAFQSIVALGNLDGAAKGRPLLDAGTERRSGADIHYAMYSADDADDNADKSDRSAKSDKRAAGKADKNDRKDKKDKKKDDAYLNFSPALVISDDYLMLCSTKQVAEELADLASRARDARADGGRAEAAIPENTLVQIDAKLAAALLKANREQLVSQNMLQKGHGREAAEKEIDLLVGLVNAFQGGTLRLTPTDKSVRLEVEFKSAP